MQKKRSNLLLKKSILRKSIFFFLLFVFGCPEHFGQSFPLWLMNQGDIRCRKTAVGFSLRSYYQDTSAVSLAIARAAEQLVKQERVSIVSLKSFWTTARGTEVMDNAFVEQFDTTLVPNIRESAAVLDTYISDDFVAVLLSTDNCKESFSKELINISTQSEPDWVTDIPQNDHYIYAVGSAPEYYYKTSSLYEAEKQAYYALAASKNAKLKSLQKSETIVEEQREEEITVELYGVEILKRWRDDKEKVFYVLARMPKQ